MVGTPVRRHSSRHRRAASILAQRAISLVSPLRESDRRRERRRLARNRRTRAKAAVPQDMRSFFGLPQPRRQQRVVVPPRVDPAPPVIVLTDTSLEDIHPPPPTQQHVLVDLDSSLDTLPDIDPRPQWQLPVEPLQDLGPLDVTAVFQPPLQHQVFREAYVLLQYLQLPPLQPLTPPPELPPRNLTPPHDPAVDWVELEAAVATFDGQQYLVVPWVPLLQQPEVVPVLQHVPISFAAPLPMPEVDWANIAQALFSIVERQSQQRAMNNN